MAPHAHDFLQAIPHLAYATDTDRCITMANPRFAALTHQTVDDLIGSSLAEALPPHLAAPALEHEAQVEAIQMPLTREHEILIQGRDVRVFLITKFPLTNPSGTLTGVGTFGIDITETTRERQAATREATFIRQVLDVVPNLIFTKDKSGRFTLANQATAELFRLTPDRLLGRTEAELGIDPDTASRSQREDQTVLQEGKERLTPEEMRKDYAGNTRWFRAVRRPLRTASGRLEQLLGVATDITEYRNAQQAKLQIKEERMEAIGRLAGGIAHDFNNLLTVLRTSAELLKYEVAERVDLVDLVDEIIVSSDRATKLTQHLLAYGRRQMLRPQLVNLNAIVSEIKGVLQRILGAKVELSLRLKSELPPVRVDRGSMDQILVNLATNARDAMPHGGRLTVETCTREGRLAGSDHDGIVELCITDTGTGIGDDVVDHIFEPFFTTKPQGEGTGLGLSTVYGIARQNNGDVVVDGRPGRGARFIVRLPQAQGLTEHDPQTSPSHGAKKAERVLVIDDESAIRRIVKRVLERKGYSVLVADTLNHACEAVERHNHEIDLMLIDIVMPGADGFEVAKVLRRLVPEAHILHMTGYTEHTLPPLTGPLTADYLQKPFTPEQLLSRIRSVLDGTHASV